MDIMLACLLVPLAAVLVAVFIFRAAMARGRSQFGLHRRWRAPWQD